MRSKWFSTLLVSGLLLPGMALSAAASAQEAAPAAKPADAKAEDGKDKKKANEDRWLAITNGDVYIGPGALLREATVLCKNGKIHKIGHDLELPTDTKVIDAQGMHVYPGLVSPSSSGLLGNTASDFADTIDPFNRNMILGLAAGITTTGVGNAAVKLKRFTIKDAQVRDRAFVTMVWSGRNPQGKKGLREKLVSTSEYLRQYRDWEERVKREKDLKEPAKKDVDPGILMVLRNEAYARFSANDRDDLLGIARLAQEFGFRPVIEGCTEGWTVADELGRAGAMAILTIRNQSPKDETLVRAGGSSIQNASILHRAGVPIAVVPGQDSVSLDGIVGRDIQHITVEAGFAVRGELPDDAAIASITTIPARIMGIGHRVGSIEVGKDADLIVTDGELLHYNTHVQWAIVDGKVAYDKEKEMFFAHIRPRKKSETAEVKLDKGETAPKPEDASKQDGDKPADGEKPKEGDTPKDGDKPKEGDKPEEKPKDGDKPEEKPKQG